MADNILTPIQKKKNEADKSVNKGNNWKAFGLSIIGNILLTLIIGLGGANIIFLTKAGSINDNGQYIPTVVDDNGQINLDSSKPSLLDKLMPTDESWYFNKSPTPKSLNPRTDYTHWNILNKIGVTKEQNGWPYSMYKEYSKDELDNWSNKTNWWTNCKVWFANSVATSYIWNRGLLKKLLTSFSPVIDSNNNNTNIFSNNTFQMLVISPLMYCIFPIIMVLIFVSTFFSTFADGWWKRALIGCFLYYTIFITYGVSIVQSIQYFFTLLIVPLLSNHTKVGDILAETSGTLVAIFMFLMCMSTFINLDKTMAWGFTGGYIGILIIGLIISKLSKK
jgi:hypothetical protein